MTDTAFDPTEVLRERVVALENEMADIRAYFAKRGHSYKGESPSQEEIGTAQGGG